MKTRIYASYSEFLQREDKNENGVSNTFAAEHPNWEKENETNERCWNCFSCSGCSGCSDCSGCFSCSGCSGCSGEENKKESGDTVQYAGFVIPVIQNIHQAVKEAVENPEALRMNDWHTCDTTHCRAGWVVHLAGPAGYELEKKTSTEFAAKQIYKASSSIKVSPTRFFEDSKKAMADIARCADEELKTNTTL